MTQKYTYKQNPRYSERNTEDFNFPQQDSGRNYQRKHENSVCDARSEDQFINPFHKKENNLNKNVNTRNKVQSYNLFGGKTKDNSQGSSFFTYNSHPVLPFREIPVC